MAKDSLGRDINSELSGDDLMDMVRGSMRSRTTKRVDFKKDEKENQLRADIEKLPAKIKKALEDGLDSITESLKAAFDRSKTTKSKSYKPKEKSFQSRDSGLGRELEKSLTKGRSKEETEFYKRGLKKGSIYTHDIHVEGAIKSLNNSLKLFKVDVLDSFSRRSRKVSENLNVANPAGLAEKEPLSESNLIPEEQSEALEHQKGTLKDIGDLTKKRSSRELELLRTADRSNLKFGLTRKQMRTAVKQLLQQKNLTTQNFLILKRAISQSGHLNVKDEIRLNNALEILATTTSTTDQIKKATSEVETMGKKLGKVHSATEGIANVFHKITNSSLGRIGEALGISFGIFTSGKIEQAAVESIKFLQDARLAALSTGQALTVVEEEFQKISDQEVFTGSYTNWLPDMLEKAAEISRQTGKQEIEIRAKALSLYKKGFKSLQETFKLTLKTGRLSHIIGSDFEQTTDTIADMQRYLKLSDAQTSVMTKHIADVAKITGVTGDELLGAVKSTKSIAEEMQRMGISSGQTVDNFMELNAIFKSKGLDPERFRDFELALTGFQGRQKLSEGKRRLLFTAANYGGVSQRELDSGAVGESREKRKKIGEGGLRLVNQMDQNDYLRAAFGRSNEMEIGEARQMFETMIEAAKPISERLESMTKKLEQDKEFLSNAQISERQEAINKMKNISEDSLSRTLLNSIKDKGLSPQAAADELVKNNSDFAQDIASSMGIDEKNLTGEKAIDFLKNNMKSKMEELNKNLPENEKLDSSVVEKAFADKTGKGYETLAGSIADAQMRELGKKTSEREPLKNIEMYVFGILNWLKQHPKTSASLGVVSEAAKIIASGLAFQWGRNMLLGTGSKLGLGGVARAAGTVGGYAAAGARGLGGLASGASGVVGGLGVAGSLAIQGVVTSLLGLKDVFQLATGGFTDVMGEFENRVQSEGVFWQFLEGLGSPIKSIISEFEGLNEIGWSWWNNLGSNSKTERGVKKAAVVTDAKDVNDTLKAAKVTETATKLAQSSTLEAIKAQESLSNINADNQQEILKAANTGLDKSMQSNAALKKSVEQYNNINNLHGDAEAAVNAALDAIDLEDKAFKNAKQALTDLSSGKVTAEQASAALEEYSKASVNTQKKLGNMNVEAEKAMKDYATKAEKEGKTEYLKSINEFQKKAKDNEKSLGKSVLDNEKAIAKPKLKEGAIKTASSIGIDKFEKTFGMDAKEATEINKALLSSSSFALPPSVADTVHVARPIESSKDIEDKIETQLSSISPEATSGAANRELSDIEDNTHETKKKLIEAVDLLSKIAGYLKQDLVVAAGDTGTNIKARIAPNFYDSKVSLFSNHPAKSVRV